MTISPISYSADTFKKSEKLKLNVGRTTFPDKLVKNPTEVFLQHPLYFVTGEKWSLGRSDEEMVREVLQGGVRIIQLRDKESSSAYRVEKARVLRALTHSYGALFLVNDDPNLALEVGADGVHLGQEDMPVVEARWLAARENRKLFIGLSTHNQKEVELALASSKNARPDYINVGPLFTTTTKENQYSPLVGNDLLKENTRKGEQPHMAQLDELKNLIKLINEYNEENSANSPMLFSVMGGIKARHLPALSSIGIHTFAMITELTQHPNPKSQVENLTTMIQNHKLHKSL